MIAKPTLTLDTVIARSDSVLSADTGEKMIIMGLKQEDCYLLNEIGSRIWTLLEQPRSVAEVCALLQEEYDVRPDICQRTVLAFLNELQVETMLVETQADST